MKFEDLKRVNGTLSTMDIKGKDYVLVNERVRAFRMLYPEGSILTDMLSDAGGICTFKATILNGDTILATGHAQEKESSSYINKTSYIENCETSAVGRALGFLGIGIDVSIATAEEVATAIDNQERIRAEEKTISATKAKAFREMIHNEGIPEQFILELCGISKVEEMTEGHHRWIYTHLKETKEKLNRWSARQ